MKMQYKQVHALLAREGHEWRCSAASVINEIPSGFLATYGEVAKVTNEKFGHNINARNVAWLRRHLYEITGRNSSLPLHRLARRGDVKCQRDSNQTRKESLPLRQAEGSLDNPKWWVN